MKNLHSEFFAFILGAWITSIPFMLLTVSYFNTLDRLKAVEVSESRRSASFGAAPEVPRPYYPGSLGSFQSVRSDLLLEIKLDMISGASNLCGVDRGLLLALAFRESGLKWPEPMHEAIGFMQVKPATARIVSRTLNVHRAWDNFLAGACYLRRMYDLTGDWREAVHHYNVGPAGIVTDKTRAYASDILEAM